MQLLPAAIEYKRRQADPDDFIITVSGYLESFLLPYQPGSQSSQWLRLSGSDKVLKFPVETCQPNKPLRDLADTFYSAESRNFFARVGFPDNSRGKFQAALHKQRLQGERGFYVYYVPRFHETEVNEHDYKFWHRWMDWMAEAKIPAMTHVKFLSAGMGAEAISKTMVETHHQFWETVTDLLLCRLYVGGYNVISELAMLLNVPCVIFLPEETPRFPLEIKQNVQYATRSPQGRLDFEGFYKSFVCLERLLLPEHRSWD